MPPSGINTLEQNKAAQGSLEKIDFVLEGRERKAVYFGLLKGSGKIDFKCQSKVRYSGILYGMVF